MRTRPQDRRLRQGGRLAASSRRSYRCRTIRRRTTEVSVLVLNTAGPGNLKAGRADSRRQRISGYFGADTDGLESLWAGHRLWNLRTLQCRSPVDTAFGNRIDPVRTDAGPQNSPPAIGMRGFAATSCRQSGRRGRTPHKKSTCWKRSRRTDRKLDGSRVLPMLKGDG